MPATAHSASRVAHPIIQRFFEISLYFMLFTGFATLAGTGKLDGLSLIFGTAALMGKGYVLLRHRDATIPEQWTNYLTLIYVCFFAVDYFLISQTFIDSLVHLLLFAAIVKIFAIHRDRDYVLLIALSFGMVLAATVLTVDSLFFVIFCVFVLLTVMTFVGMEMRRSWIAAQPAAPSEVPDFRDLTVLPTSVSRACVLLVLSIVLGTGALFFLIPRKPSTGYLSSFTSRSELTTGFSEEVRLGEIGHIQQSNEVVMHVKFAPDTHVPSDLRWRGVALTNFDGHKWSGPHEDGAAFANNNGSLPASLGLSRLVYMRGRTVSYSVALEPFGSRVFFVLPEALFINGRYQKVSIDSTGSIFNGDTVRAVTDYSVLSEIPPPMPANLPALDDPGVSGVYLQLPPQLELRIAEKAKEITAGQITPYQQAAALERYLSTNYLYTLQLPSVPPKDPISNFLFERKQGHCEYFASSMVIMLRTLGIPARIVNGFRGGEYNNVSGSYIVRAKDAHSWVEAYFQGYGWYTFDPTPASLAAPSPWNRAFLYMDAMHEFWHEWVVNYDTGHQNTLGVATVRQGRLGLERLAAWVRSVYTKSLETAEKVRDNFERHTNAWTFWTSLGLTLFTLAVIAPKVYFALRRFRLARKPRLEPHSAATIWYARVLKLLSRQGLRKSATQTPQEFTKTVPLPPVRERLETFTVHYERARFGDSAEDADKLPELYEELEEAAKK